jgi:uncharacterized protein (TIGR02246 family)
MRTSIVMSVVVLVMAHALHTSGAISQVDLAPALLQEMKILEETRNDAIRRKDMTTIQRLYAQDFSGVTSGGQKVTRADLIDVFQHQREGFVGASDEIAIRSLAPDAVIVTGRLTITRANDPQSPEVTSRFTHIFQRRDGRWQMVAGQSTPVLAPR